MKIIFDEKEVYELTDFQKKVIGFNIPSKEFEDDMARRSKYWLELPAKKFANMNASRMAKELKSRGKKVPRNEFGIFVALAEELPPVFGSEGINPSNCVVGEKDFVLEAPMKLALRKLLDPIQKMIVKKEVVKSRGVEVQEKHREALERRVGFKLEDSIKDPRKDGLLRGAVEDLIDFTAEANAEELARAKEEFLLRERESHETRSWELLAHKYNRCLARIHKQWGDILVGMGKEKDVLEDPVAFAEWLFLQPFYKDRDARDLEEAP